MTGGCCLIFKFEISNLNFQNSLAIGVILRGSISVILHGNHSDENPVANSDSTTIFKGMTRFIN
jgi:hypothetical protein